MSFKQELLEALRSFRPQSDQSKALLEHDPSAIAVSRLLSEPQGLPLVEYIASDLQCGKRSLYSINRFLEKTRFSELIEHFYSVHNQAVLDTLLTAYYQFWIRPGENAAKATYDILRKLDSSEAIISRAVATNVCMNCYAELDKGTFQCVQCGRDEVLTVRDIFLAPNAKTALKNGQYLELYAKECLSQSGVELIGWEVDKRGTKAFISVKYQVDGEQIDVDVHGIAEPLTLVLCEVKTSEKILMNELRRVEDLFDRLSERINELSGRNFKCLKMFIITGEFDQNISIGAYKRKYWELMSRASIVNLVEELRKVQNEL